MSTFIIALGFFSIVVWLLWRRKRCFMLEDIKAKGSQLSCWLSRYPGKDVDIEKYLRIFCISFEVLENFWENFGPDDTINIVYNQEYSGQQISDCLEHAIFFMELEKQLGWTLPETGITKDTTLCELYNMCYSHSSGASLSPAPQPGN